MAKLFQKLINLCFNRTFNFILFFFIIFFMAQENIVNDKDKINESLIKKIEYNKEKSEETIRHLKNSMQIMKYNAEKHKKIKRNITRLNDNLELSIKLVNNNDNKDIDANEIMLYIELNNQNQLARLLINKKIGDTFFVDGNSLFSSLANLNTNKDKNMYKITIKDIVNDRN